ncbi:MAG TPA: SPFH domain-containing protein [Pyrinomonadaceae bacterium]|nr:SPFH domain-containing protein [Pyrinomonadaceae bacterium]
MPINVEVLFIPIVVVLILLAVLVAFWLLSRNYIKVAPNAAAVFSGRKRKLPDGRVVGYRVIKGGAALRIPLLEKVDYLSLNVMTIPLEIRRAYTLKGVPVSVKAVANVKIKGDDVSLQAAAERFLGMPVQEVQRVIFQTLEGHLRAILGGLTVEEINNDRQTFAQKLTSEAASDLERMGIGVDVLTIQEISDEEGYLDALGKRRTAEVKRDAQIGEAEATRDSKIKASVAMQEGEKVKLESEANIALASREMEVKRAQYQAEIESERARAEQAGPLSGAKARQSVIAEEVRIERIRTQEQIAVQEQEILRREKELEATVVRPADAQRTAAIMKAEAQQKTFVLEAEGKKQAAIAIAEAEQERLRKEGAGRAAAVEAEGRAEAAKIEAIGIAQAKAIEAQGLAEANAILKKAEAWKEFNEAAKLQTILERLPNIIEASAPVFAAVSSPLGNIDKVVVIDQGGGNGNGNGHGATSGVGRFAATGPAVIFSFLQQLEALGLNVPDLLTQLGIQKKAEEPTVVVEVPAPPAPLGK